MKFLEYLEKRNSYETDIKSTLNKIPKSHYDLVKDYKIIFQSSNTLKNDDDHIGLIDEKNKTITIASPWNYGKEFTLLHEIAHAVWKYALSKQKKQEWSKLFKEAKYKNKKDLSQNEEEIFCMTYAQYYAKNKMKKFDHESLLEFISRIA
jgi:hypothetical protein